jgi:O-acetyl-ADP-ribose deacetylase (regulator of RNase III)
MGAGLAAQIKQRYPELYDEYRMICNGSANKLGTVFVYRAPNYWIANIFGQDGFGREKRHLNYDALRKGLSDLQWFIDDNQIKSIAFPKYMGCGLAGGDWDTVLDIMADTLNVTSLDIQLISYKGR